MTPRVPKMAGLHSGCLQTKISLEVGCDAFHTIMAKLTETGYQWVKDMFRGMFNQYDFSVDNAFREALLQVAPMSLPVKYFNTACRHELATCFCYAPVDTPFRNTWLICIHAEKYARTKVGW